MNHGYIKLWRKSLDSSTWQNHDVFRFWVWCLMKASHKSCVQIVGRQEVKIEPGQFVFGRKIASLECGLSERTIRTCLSTIKTTSNVTIKTTNKFSIITIINWERYQSVENEIDQQIDQQTVHKVTTNKKYKNKRKEILGQLGQNPTLEVIEYLNQKAGKNFKPNGANAKFINARLGEGATVEQCKSIIDAKVNEWAGDEKMSKFLRPETLFNQTKFESYLNALIKPPQQKRDLFKEGF